MRDIIQTYRDDVARNHLGALGSMDDSQTAALDTVAKKEYLRGWMDGYEASDLVMVGSLLFTLVMWAVAVLASWPPAVHLACFGLGALSAVAWPRLRGTR